MGSFEVYICQAFEASPFIGAVRSVEGSTIYKLLLRSICIGWKYIPGELCVLRAALLSGVSCTPPVPVPDRRVGWALSSQFMVHLLARVFLCHSHSGFSAVSGYSASNKSC